MTAALAQVRSSLQAHLCNGMSRADQEIVDTTHTPNARVRTHPYIRN
jgi:hypothetical protein